MLFASGGFLLLWTLSITWEFHSLTDLDDFLTRLLNRLTGQSETLDLTLIFLSRTPGTYLTILLYVTTVFLLSAGKNPRKPRSLFAYFIYLSMLAVLGGLVVETFDHYVQRPAPPEALRNFRPLEKTFGMEVSSPPKTTFPDTRISILSLLFFLAFFRFGARTLLFAIWLLVLAVADVFGGRSWPSDAAGAFVFGWLFASLVYVSGTNDFYKRTESLWSKWITDHARHAFIALKQLGRLVKFRSRAGNLALRTSMPGTPPEHVLALLAGHYGLDGASLLAAPHKNKLFAISAEGKRFAFKKTRSSISHSRGLETTLRVVCSLRDDDAVFLPRIVPARNGSLLVSDGRHCYYLMEWAEGHSLNFADRRHVRALFEALAWLHVKTALRDSGEEAIEKLQSLVHAFRHRSELEREARAELSRWLMPKNAEPALREAAVRSAHTECEIIARSAFTYLAEDGNRLALSHIHRDIHPMNFLCDDHLKITVLDFDRIRPGLPVMDLASAMHRACRTFLWDFEKLDDYLDCYLKIKPLTRTELTVLLAYVLLPVPELKPRSKQRASPLSAGKQHGDRVPLRPQVDAALKDEFMERFCLKHDLDLPLLLTGGNAFHHSFKTGMVDNERDSVPETLSR